MSKYAHKTSCPLTAEFRAMGPETLTLHELNALMAETLKDGIGLAYYNLYEPAVANNQLVKIRREKEGDANLVTFRFFNTNDQANDFAAAWATISASYFALYPDVVPGYSVSIEVFDDAAYDAIDGNVNLVTFTLE